MASRIRAQRFARPGTILFLWCLALVGCLPASERDQGAAVTAPAVCGYRPYEGDLAGWLSGVRLVNYSPAHAAHSRMWTDWQPATVDADLERIQALDGNAVRYFVYVNVAGFPAPSESYLDRLEQALALASEHCLSVQLSLFAFFNAYHDIAGSKRWAEEILDRFGSDRRIALLELQNEIDASDPAAVAWARELAAYTRSRAPGLPLTLSFKGDQLAGIERARAAGIAVDYLSLHYYGKPELAYATLLRARDLAAPLPLFIGETGYSSIARPGRYDSGWWECYQGQYLRSVALAAGTIGLPPAAPWTLFDFTPDSFPPGTRADQAVRDLGYGLVTAEGRPKPALEAVQASFARRPPDRGINNSFEEGAGLPDCWLLWQADQASFGLDRTVAHTGSASARISRSAGSPAGEPAFYLTPVAVIQPGKSYIATAWARGAAAGGTTRVALAWFDAASRYIATSASTPLPAGDTAWSRLTVTAVAPANAAYVQLLLISTDNPGTVWFDDVSFD